MARYSRNDRAGVELPKTKLNRESLRQALELFRYLRPYRLRFSAALVSLFTGSLLSLPLTRNSPRNLAARSDPAEFAIGCVTKLLIK